MHETLNDLLELLRIFLEGLGIKSGTIQLLLSSLAFISLFLIIGNKIFFLFHYAVLKRRNKILARDLHPFYSAKEIEYATKYYINTKFQNVPPTEDEEPGRNYIAAASQPLIPLFLNKAFKNSKDDNKYYLILADSGMGKTTFMINLYLSYRFKKVKFWNMPKYNIKLFPLGDPNTIDRIKLMTTAEKENCILLLDAFDEDNEAVINYNARLSELLSMVWEFREIVITCRTQFFPSSKDEPTETGKFKFGPIPGSYHFQKIYLSVFSEKDIKQYLKKRFKPFILFNSSRYLKALGIVLKSPNLMMRPMLLSHIDDLVSSRKAFNYSFQVYEILIDKWLLRESNKSGIRLKYGDTYKNLLFTFSKALARELYVNRDSRNNQLSLRYTEIIDNPNGLQLSDLEGTEIGIDKYDQTSRSLLNRNAVGEYKFAHKSILEYFLALEVIENLEFRRVFYFDSDLDTSKKFFFEMLLFKDIPEELKKDIKFSNLGLSSEEISKLTSTNYYSQSYDVILNKLFKSTLSSTFYVIIILVIVFAAGFIVNRVLKENGLLIAKKFDVTATILIAILPVFFITINGMYSYLKARRDLLRDERSNTK